jgi:hypothetical protein
MLVDVNQRVISDQRGPQGIEEVSPHYLRD